MCVLIIFPFVMAGLAEIYFRNQHNIPIRIKLSQFYESLYEGDRMSLHYHTIFLVRRGITVFLLIYQKDNPNLQVFTVQILTMIQISYLILVKPFDNAMSDRYDTINECFVLGC
jgi:hypothetical protein